MIAAGNEMSCVSLRPRIGFPRLILAPSSRIKKINRNSNLDYAERDVRPLVRT